MALPTSSLRRQPSIITNIFITFLSLLALTTSHDSASSRTASIESRSSMINSSISLGNDWRSKAFLATLKEAECDICGDRFNEVHVPVKLPCHHVAGLHCIRDRVLSPVPSHNKCPKCKATLFNKGRRDKKGEDDATDTRTRNLLARSRHARTARSSTDSADSTRDFAPVVVRFSNSYRPPSNLSQSNILPRRPLQQQHLQRHINDLHQFVLMSSGPPEPREHLLSLPGIPRIPRSPTSPGSSADPPNFPPLYSPTAMMRTAANSVIADTWLNDHRRESSEGPRQREASLVTHASPYPTLAENLRLMEYLTQPHMAIDPHPAEGVRGEWPYQYPAGLQPKFDNPRDTALHCLAQSIIARRWEVLRRRGELRHLRCHPLQDEHHPEYDLAAVKNMLWTGTGKGLDASAP